MGAETVADPGKHREDGHARLSEPANVQEDGREHRVQRSKQDAPRLSVTEHRSEETMARHCTLSRGAGAPEKNIPAHLSRLIGAFGNHLAIKVRCSRVLASIFALPFCALPDLHSHLFSSTRSHVQVPGRHHTAVNSSSDEFKQGPTWQVVYEFLVM